MAAYGALVSLSHLLHQILHPPPLFINIIVFHEQQIEFLRAKIELLIDFLETYPSRGSSEFAELEARIRDAAYAAEDIVESNVIDQIHASDLYRRVETSILSSQNQEISIPLSQQRKTPTLSSQGEIFTQGIERVLEMLISIEKDKDLLKMRVLQGVGDVQLKNSAAATPPPGGKITMVGFDHHMLHIMSELASDESSLRIIPIVGMGGIGKTTLASAVYNNLFIAEQFHVRAWVTVSQEYDGRELILCLLSEINKSCQDGKESSDDEPGLQIYKKLFGRRYLIVMDDMWDIQAWVEVKRFLPDNENGSRVLVTSRLSNLADDLGSYSPYKMDFLDEGHSWNLFCKNIFAEEDCPVELEGIGKYIVERCGGLPLALVLISGLLLKSKRTREHWELFGEDMTSALNFGNDEQAMKILSLSYTHLPVYLKPCFLFLMVFPEDSEIHVSTLIRLWVAEGLIKQNQAKCLEETAQEYLEDLVSRNLVIIGKRGSMGNMKSCKVHDLVRDLCITHAQKEKFECTNFSPNVKTVWLLSFYATGGRQIRRMVEASLSASLNRSLSSPLLLENYRIFRRMIPIRRMVEASQSASLNRSLSSPLLLEHNRIVRRMIPIRRMVEASQSDSLNRSLSSPLLLEHNRIVRRMTATLITEREENMKTNDFRLLKVVYDREHLIELLNLSNLRFVYAHSLRSAFPMLLCWNLQTLVVHGDNRMLNIPPEIWLMPQLRHLKLFAFALPDPPDDDKNVIVLENLQTIKGVELFKCSEHVLKRIPNLKKLKTSYIPSPGCDFSLHNLGSFQKLESLDLKICYDQKLWPTISFPTSLKKLTLGACMIFWEDLSIVGSLPNLEVLKLDYFATIGEQWDPIEGQFCRLKYLAIFSIELKIWGAENYHFPCLEHLYLIDVPLEKIPISFSEILTLQQIGLRRVKDSLWISAKKISNEREELGYEPLLLHRKMAD